MVYALQQCSMSVEVKTSDDPRPDHKHEYSDRGRCYPDWQFPYPDHLDQGQVSEEDADVSEVSEEDADVAEVSLHPFRHQVAGHTQILLLDSSTLCKALQPTEHNFYLHTPKEMQKFVPKYKGVIQVSRSDGMPLALRYTPCKAKDQGMEAPHTGALADWKRGNTEALRVRVHHNEDSSDSSSWKETSVDGWSASDKQHFLLLENVGSHYGRPCALDLKMGTRQHGDDAPADKQARDMAKCAASTSAALGVRLCGMQVYQVDSCRFKVKDKYCGRRLDEAGFKRALGLFFHNGFQLRIDVIDKVVKRLRALRRAVEKQNTFRFYSSSLLIMYDGWVRDQCTFSEGEMLHPLQEHHASFLHTSVGIHCRFGGDRPFVHGAQNLHIQCEEAMFPDSDHLNHVNSSETSYCRDVSVNSSATCRMRATSTTSSRSMSVDSGMELSDDSLTDSEDFSDSHGAFYSQQNKSLPFSKANMYSSDFPQVRELVGRCSSGRSCCASSVDVRMIDFAHTTFGRYMGESVHRGPDKGYIQGLDSLVRLLLEILDEA